MSKIARCSKFVALFVTAMIAFATSYSSGQDYSSQESIGGPVTGEQALERAHDVTAFDIFDPAVWRNRISDIVDSLIITDTLTPFMHDSINGRSAWRIRVEQVQPDFGSQTKRSSTTNKDCEIWVDCGTGRFLMATFKERGSDSVLERPPTAREAEAQLAALGEDYVGLPTVFPAKTLREALESCNLYPPIHEQTVVHYCLYSFRGSEPRPAWIIYERSTRELFPAHDPRLYAKSNKRTVIDANTGERMLTINQPYPLLEGGFGIEPDGK